MEPFYTNHERQFESLRFVYPVISRRAGGLSVGINLNPDKHCNFDCPYCQVDRTIPSPTGFEQDLAQKEFLLIENWIRSGLLFTNPRFENVPDSSKTWIDIAFSGDGEPSVSNHLEPMMRWLQTQSTLRELPQIVLISNATGFQKASTQRALETLHELRGCVWAKLDSGTDSLFKLVSGSSYSVEGIMEQILSLPRGLELKIQTCLMKVRGELPQTKEILEYRTRLETIHQTHKISEVQIYTIARKPAKDFVAPLTLQELKLCTRALEDLPIPISLYPGAAD